MFWTSLCVWLGKKKQHKHKLFDPDFPRTFLTLTPECPGVKKFLPTTGAAGKRTFWCGRPRFSARTSMTRRVVEKLCTKKVCVDFSAPMWGNGAQCFAEWCFRREANIWKGIGHQKTLEQWCLPKTTVGASKLAGARRTSLSLSHTHTLTQEKTYRRPQKHYIHKKWGEAFLRRGKTWAIAFR